MQVDLYQFKDHLIYRASSRPVVVTVRQTLSPKKTHHKKKTQHMRFIPTATTIYLLVTRIPLSEALEEKPLVVEMLSSSC